jgi:hypothetical protein
MPQLQLQLKQELHEQGSTDLQLVLLVCSACTADGDDDHGMLRAADLGSGGGVADGDTGASASGCSLRELHLDGNGLTAATAREIAEALQSGTAGGGAGASLEHFDLGFWRSRKGN